MPDHRARLLAEQLRVADRLLRDGFAREAEAAALQCLSENPECPSIYCLLGEIEESLGRQERAVIALKKAATLDPDNPMTWSRLGEIQALRARWREAEEAYRHASKLLPASPIPLAALASTQLAAQRIEAALATGSILLGKFPDSADALLMHGHLCKVLGEFENAASAYERALKLAPESSAAAYSLTDLQVPLPSDSRARAIERRLQCDDLPDSDRVNFEFALARIYEGAKQYELAFMHYTNAKEATRKSLNRRGLSYDFEGCEEKNKLIMLRYQTGSFQAKLPPLPIRLRPIFIVGMPRAGTTLVEQILSSHPLVSSAGEINAAPRCHELYLARCSQLGVERFLGPVSARAGRPAFGDARTLRRSTVRVRSRERTCDRQVAGKLPTPGLHTDHVPGCLDRPLPSRANFHMLVLVHVELCCLCAVLRCARESCPLLPSLSGADGTLAHGAPALDVGGAIRKPRC